MLQRAASNAYSWWWASHIRTKQSKWMEQNLQDMEEKVSIMLKLIEEDGDSFARRAEMYFKRRPELIQFVEEFYRAYRALAERYDHISKELQSANNTIATVCPEQAQFAMDDEEEVGSPRFSKKPPATSKGNIPKVPDIPVKDLKGFISSAKKKTAPKKPMKITTNAVPKSGLTKAEGLEEIHRLQKRILALQTEKEFVKSSYESGVAKYWGLDDEIKEMQERVYSLEDEFGEGRVIEDDEARTVMAATALQSCKETLTQLQVKQEKSVMEAEEEQKRITDAREKLHFLKNKFLSNETDLEQPSDGDKSGRVSETSKMLEQEASDTAEKRKDMESLKQKIKEQLEVGPSESLSVTEMVEKVDELVNKIISLESAISYQTVLIQRLRTETDELQAQIQTLEDDKVTLIDGKNDLRNKLMEMEEKFHGIQDLNQSVEDQNNNLQTHFTEAHCNLDHLSEKVHTIRPDEELAREESSSVEAESSKEQAIEDNDKMTKEVKEDKEFVVADEPAREKSPAEVESPKESEEQERRNLDANDGCKNLQSAKQATVVVSDSLSKEEDCVVKLASPKEPEEKGEKLDQSEGCTKGGDAESEAREDVEELYSVKTSTNEGDVEHETSKASEKCEDLIAEDKVDKQAPAEVESSKESEEQERRNLDASNVCKNLQSAKQATVVVSDSLSKEEDCVIKLASPKDSEEKGEKLDQSEGCTKGGDAESEAREDVEELYSVKTSTNEGDVEHETSKASEKCEDLIAEDKVDKQAPAEVESPKESEEQERRNLDASDGCKNLQSAKQATVVVSDSLSKEEDCVVKLASPKEPEEKGEKLDQSEGCTKGGDAESEAREDVEELYSVKTSTNEGDVEHETSKALEKCEDLIAEDKVDKQAPLLTVDALAKDESKEQERGQEDEPDWKQLFSKGIGEREKILLTEYTSALRKYKDTKKKLGEVEASNQNILFEIMLQLKELKSTNAMKDEEIRSLHQKLSLLQTGIGENNGTDSEKPVVTDSSATPSPEDEDVELTLVNQSPPISEIEEKFRMEIDALLEENLEFWFRFSTAFHEVQKFENGVKDLTAEVSKLGERQKQEGSSTQKYSLESDVRPLYKHLKEVQNELNLWVENSVLLKEELKKRFSSLCEIQEEITKALKASAEDDDFSFTSYQSVKFQGEILNMKQENNKVADELQAGFDHVTALQIEVDRSLSKLTEDWGLSGSKTPKSSTMQQSHSRSGVPLRSYVFGSKSKKQKKSIFSYVHPTLHRKFSNSRPEDSSNQ